MSELKPFEERVYYAIKDYWAEHGTAPSEIDLLEATKTSSNSYMGRTIKNLHEKGYISKRENIARSTRIIKELL